jgi:hypothetical protein
MVKVTNYAIRSTKDGKPFVSLELTSGLELVQSQETGRFYATVRKCFIPTTFDETVARTMIGTTLEGTLVRIEVAPYDFNNPDTGEVMKLNYSWGYLPEGAKQMSTHPKNETREVL